MLNNDYVSIKSYSAHSVLMVRTCCVVGKHQWCCLLNISQNVTKVDSTYCYKQVVLQRTYLACWVSNLFRKVDKIALQGDTILSFII